VLEGPLRRALGVSSSTAQELVCGRIYSGQRAAERKGGFRPDNSAVLDLNDADPPSALKPQSGSAIDFCEAASNLGGFEEKGP